MTATVTDRGLAADPVSQARLEREVRELSARLVESEAQYAETIRLLLAERRLAECTDRAGLIAAVQEIVASVVGCEDYTILALDEKRWTLWPLGGEGPHAGAAGLPTVDHPVIGYTIRRCTPYYRDDTVPGIDRGDIVACIPLCFGDHAVGVLVLFTLLPHRGPLTAIDRELLESIGSSLVGRTLLADLAAGAVTVSLL